MHKTQDEHQAEIAGWKQKNSELLKKMKAKVRGVEVTWPLLHITVVTVCKPCQSSIREHLEAKVVKDKACVVSGTSGTTAKKKPKTIENY